MKKIFTLLVSLIFCFSACDAPSPESEGNSSSILKDYVKDPKRKANTAVDRQENRDQKIKKQMDFADE